MLCLLKMSKKKSQQINYSFHKQTATKTTLSHIWVSKKIILVRCPSTAHWSTSMLERPPSSLSTSGRLTLWTGSGPTTSLTLLRSGLSFCHIFLLYTILLITKISSIQQLTHIHFFESSIPLKSRNISKNLDDFII